MRFRDFTITLAPVLFFILFFGCGGSFSRRADNSMRSMQNTLKENDPDIVEYWCAERGLHLLKTDRKFIRTNGYIYFAVLVTANKSGEQHFCLGYLADEANVNEIVVLADKTIIWEHPPPARNLAKLAEADFVTFRELFVWKDDNPLRGCTNAELQVLLVKDNGETIGPVPILTDRALWDEIREKMISDTKWQNRFPWLHRRLQESPEMAPLWRDPDKLRQRYTPSITNEVNIPPSKNQADIANKGYIQ